MNNYDDNTTPEALLDLLHMGTQLRTTELRIQEALRAKHLITIFKVLISEDNADSSEDYSRVEKLLGMDKILPDQGVEATSEKKWLKVKKSIVDRNRLRRKRPVNLDFLVNSLLYDKWRYIPECGEKSDEVCYCDHGVASYVHHIEVAHIAGKPRP